VIAVRIRVPTFNLENSVEISTAKRHQVDVKRLPYGILRVVNCLRAVDHDPITAVNSEFLVVLGRFSLLFRRVVVHVSVRVFGSHQHQEGI